MTRSVCFVVTSPRTAKGFLSGYLGEMRERDWRVTLVCGSDLSIRAFADAEGVDFRAVPLARNPSVLSDIKALARMVRVLREVSPDAVIYATPKASLLAALASKITHVPVRIYEQWGLRLESTSGILRRVLYFMEWITIRYSTEVVANSKSLARQIEAIRLAKRGSVLTLGAGSSHGVDTTKFSADCTHAPLDAETSNFLATSHGITIGFVGRLHPDKGVDVLLEALRICEREGLQFRALLVGEDEGLGLTDGTISHLPVHVVGRVVDTRPYYDVMDVLVLMSKREGFPNVVLEAAAMGVPAVVSDGTGAIDSVVDGVTGIVVPIGDTTMLAGAIRNLSQNPEHAASLGAAARARVLREFDHKVVRERHINLFESAMGGAHIS